MKIRTPIVAALAGVAGLLIGLAGTAGAQPVVRAASAAPADTAQPCNQLLNPDPHLAFVCVAANAFKQPNGADYWMDTAYGRDQFIHPAGTNFDVASIYFCRPNGIIVGGHVQSVDEGSTPTESWCERGAPGVPTGEAEWQARVTAVYDGHGACIVYDWKIVDTNASPPNPTVCFDLYTGKTRHMTAAEIKSVADSWRAEADEPGAW